MIVSHVKAIIPESVKQAWHDWRSAMKKSEKEITGENTISDGAEMAGWGVEEAEERNNSHASMLSPHLESSVPRISTNRRLQVWEHI